ncbi:MAG: aminopeptidase [Alicyclobacillaceae bacterium]|jgi:aminopeptidase|uniref:aminopeptidase n=1 Tax=Alicyclobacillus sp. SP_1 TaxID=2942475 RepID=UPI0021573D8C|nr:aminopeptidase [Alicyclobacillus sp. SP_1]MCY0888599.1 aminopeptidase [Alicyclobacillaceae bacterium]
MLSNTKLSSQRKKYAELVIKVGVNLQPGQHLVIGFASRQVYPEHVEFARDLTSAAYDAGAKFVHVDYGDEWWLRETVQRGALSTLAERAAWQAQWVQKLADEGAAFVAIPASNPHLFDGVPRGSVDEANKAIAGAFRSFNDRRTNNEYSWTLASAPTEAWADVVHADLPKEERVAALWQGILQASRATGEQPVEDWRAHLERLKRRSDWLNRLGIRQLHYRAPGTDLTIDMHERHYWTAAGQPTQGGIPFVANIPTEEVFSAPLRTGVHGKVRSTMPLVHNGSLIEGIELTFSEGRIVDYRASRGQDALQHIVEADEGSHYLGEVALVPVDSPISQMGTLFYNTLFDENASCHLAIGKAYPLIEGGHGLTREQWSENGLNESLMHVDFMIGSTHMDIDAKTSDGRVVPLFSKGKWTEQV